MNYYNPYFYTIPSNIATPKIGLLTRLFGRSGVTIGNILNGTQRALNFANQAIPLVKQVRPMIGNAKTMFKVMNEFKRTEKPIQNTTIIQNNKNIKNEATNNNIENITTNIKERNNYIESDNGPTFFV